jgi:hypothetical protein
MKTRMTSRQLATALLARARTETDPVEKAILKDAAEALEHKRPRGRKPNEHLHRQDDIQLVERYHELKKKLEHEGINEPAAQAFQRLADERGLQDGESARRIYSRAVDRSRLSPEKSGQE